tara:strand:+ start:396 stop:992 length:597 start_codon:yes stop_codon:yes gene_type:complete
MNEKIFYVCSYGGSGSKMLCNSLKKYGKSYHIHSRNPPDKLEYIGDQQGNICNRRCELEWFNGKVISEKDLRNYYVIYIYRNPSFAISSRFNIPLHLINVQTDKSIKLKHVLDSKKDLYKIKEFYDNYTKPNEKRNYKIYCVKYEDIFDKQDELSKLLGIGKLNLINKSSVKDSNKELDIIYEDLINEMNKNDFITIN